MESTELDERFKPENWGKCKFFDVQPWIKVIDQLASADEVLSALKVCDMLPGYYRNHEPKEITDIRARLLSKVTTVSGYASNMHDMRVDLSMVDIYKGTVRANLIRIDVENYNKEGKIPHIIDLGPGEYALELMLKQLDLKFTYMDLGIHPQARDRARELLPGYYKEKPDDDQPVIFVACELIEHLHHETDIYIDFMRTGGRADKIHMSTPNCTFDGFYEDAKVWERRDSLGHLRTYTLQEFASIVQKMFRNYTWQFVDSIILHAVGVPKNENNKN